MKRLILTTDGSAAGALKGAGLADAVIPFGHRFVWGPLPSDGETDDRTGIADLCQPFDAINLWIDPDPNAQLILLWLLDTLRPHEQIVSKLGLVQADAMIGDHSPEQLVEWRLPVVKILKDHLQTASKAWQAYRAPTPRDWFKLLPGDLRALPRLEPAMLALLEELPMRTSGLGATEMRMLELVAEGDAGPFDVFPGHEKRNKRRVFGYWEVGHLLDGLARCPAPAIAGLDEGPFTLEMHDDRVRHARYKQSRLSLTALGKAVLAGSDDFSLKNPIHRWWGGTELTNDRFWRWDKADRALIEP
jgi:hypothetical protein